MTDAFHIEDAMLPRGVEFPLSLCVDGGGPSFVNRSWSEITERALWQCIVIELNCWDEIALYGVVAK